MTMPNTINHPYEYRMFQAALEARAQRDPHKLWQPHPGQIAFMNSVLRSDCYENWLVPGNRWGKTEVGAFCGSALAREGIPASEVKPAIGQQTVVWDRATSGLVACVNEKSLNEAVLPKYFDNSVPGAASPFGPFIPPWEIAEFKASEDLLKLKNGSLISYRTYNQDVTAVASVGRDWVHLDEPPPIGHYREIAIRVRANRRLRLFATCTLLPSEGASQEISWVYQEKLVPVLRKEPVAWQAFGGAIYDNPHIPQEELERLEAIYPVGSLDRRIRLDGEWLPGIVGDRVYGNFQESVHVRRLGAMLPYYPMAWVLDFNVEPQVSLVGQFLTHQDGLPLFNVHGELVLESGGTAEKVEQFMERYPNHPHELHVFGDASGHKRGQTNRTDYQIILNHLRHYPSPLRMKVPEANPLEKDRVNAVNQALSNADGRRGMQIDPSCVELIADFNGVVRDRRTGGIRKTYGHSDPYSRRTHASDAVGYWVHRLAPVKALRTGPQSAVPMNRPSYGAQTNGAPSYGRVR